MIDASLQLGHVARHRRAGSSKGLATALLCGTLVASSGCLPAIAFVLKGLADTVSNAVDVPLNELPAPQTIGLQFANDGDAAVSLDIDLDQAQGLTNTEGLVIAGAASFRGIQLVPGQVLGDLSGHFSDSDLLLFDGAGLYPCVQGRVCVRVTRDGQVLDRMCLVEGQDFDCGQGLIFTVAADGHLEVATQPLEGS